MVLSGSLPLSPPGRKVEVAHVASQTTSVVLMGLGEAQAMARWNQNSWDLKKTLCKKKKIHVLFQHRIDTVHLGSHTKSELLMGLGIEYLI
jgi:hypothetical protein